MLKADVARIAALFAEGLDRFGGPWLAGDTLTAADAFFAPVAYRIRTYSLDVGAGQAWVDRIIAHPAMQAWEAAALAETYREVGHEAELAACGDVLSDYRHG
jgi:glutathione S-transferase